MLALTSGVCELAGVTHAPQVAYSLDFAAMSQHELEITARLPAAASGPTEVFMATWTPGSYLVREYARHVVALTASDDQGLDLPVAKVRKNRWRITAGSASTIVLRYRLYCREMSVRTNWVDPEFALLNGAATFITRVDGTAWPHAVRVHLPPPWSQVVTALPAQADAPAHTYLAADFDALVDAPLFLGSPEVETFLAAGRPHRLATQGNLGFFNAKRAAADVARIVETTAQLWGQVPYADYVFINLLGDGRGGLEHRDSSVLMATQEVGRSVSGYIDWLGLVAHEHFHAWNIKRLRPAILGPFDYEQEAPTTSLWVAEGLTAYYDDLLVHRAGLCPEAVYLQRLSRNLEQVQGTPGRLLQPLGAASYDAWIKFYRRDENSDNAGVNYYTKGAVVGFLLDAQIRLGSGDARCLDDVMRAAYAAYSGAQGYTEAQLRRCIETAAGLPLGDWLAAAVDGTGELDYAPALRAFGLQFLPPELADPTAAAGSLGITARADSARLLVAQVRRDGPAYAAGLQVDDEILAVDGWRLPAQGWQQRLRAYAPGTVVTLQLARRQRLQALRIEFAAEPPRVWRLGLDANASPEQLARRQAWLTGQARARPAA